jgi:arsenite methyltransferase
MTLACPIGFDGEELHRHVVSMYERVAARPGDAFHFHVGVDYAADWLGYDRAELEALPTECTARFAGVGNPFTAGSVPDGAVVVDHACGAGTDLLIAARRAGSDGRAIGIDITPAMRATAQRAAVAAGLADRVEVLPGSFDALPLAAASVDVVLSNGVLNLATDKLQVLREAHRVLRPGGILLLADVVLDRRLDPVASADPQLWAACVGGALTEQDLLHALRLAGFVGSSITGRWACYRGTSVERKFGSSLRVEAIAVGGRKAA